MGRSIGGRVCCRGGERQLGDDVPARQGVAEYWVGREVVDRIGCAVGFEFDVASCRGRIAGQGLILGRGVWTLFSFAYPIFTMNVTVNGCPIGSTRIRCAL